MTADDKKPTERDALEAETARWIAFYREHPELKAQHAERSRVYSFPNPASGRTAHRPSPE